MNPYKVLKLQILEGRFGFSRHIFERFKEPVQRQKPKRVAPRASSFPGKKKNIKFHRGVFGKTAFIREGGPWLFFVFRPLPPQSVCLGYFRSFLEKSPRFSNRTIQSRESYKKIDIYIYIYLHCHHLCPADRQVGFCSCPRAVFLGGWVMA